MAARSRKGRRNVKIVDEDDAPPAPSSPRSRSPANWRRVYDNILKMREARDAPVDSMGCERAHDEMAEPKVQRFQCLVSLMLSSQTKDEVNYAAMKKLREYGLTAEKMMAASEKQIGDLIYPVGFWKRKAGYIRRTSEILSNDYCGDIPDNVTDLCKLPGVGPKMAHLCMNIAWKKQSGIGVDTHVHRICNRLGWVRTRMPEDTRRSLESWLPQDKWTEINWLLVGFGQQTCKPVRPSCERCLNRKLCPVGKKMKD